MRLAIADENQHRLHSELMGAVEAASRDMGIDVARVGGAETEAQFDALLMLGYPRYYPSFEHTQRRTRRISWYGENLPKSPASPVQRLERALPSARLFDLAHDSAGRLAGRRARNRMLRWRERAATEREIGHNLAELQRARSWIDELVVVSGSRASGARLAGWRDVRCVPFGYHETMAGPLVPPQAPGRDIDVLFLGRDLDERVRRTRMLAEFRARLGDRARLVTVDRGAYGAERHSLIARARVVLDIHRLPANSTGIRYLLATAAGAAFVNEETHDDWLPAREQHVVEVPAGQLADEVVLLLADEPRRRRLVDAGQELLRSDLAMKTSLDRVLERPERLPAARDDPTV